MGGGSSMLLESGGGPLAPQSQEPSASMEHRLDNGLPQQAKHPCGPHCEVVPSKSSSTVDSSPINSTKRDFAPNRRNWLAALVYLQQIERGEIPDDDLLATLPWNIRQLLISSGLELLPDDASLSSFEDGTSTSAAEVHSSGWHSTASSSAVTEIGTPLTRACCCSSCVDTLQEFVPIGQSSTFRSDDTLESTNPGSSGREELPDSPLRRVDGRRCPRAQKESLALPQCHFFPVHRSRSSSKSGFPPEIPEHNSISSPVSPHQ